MDAANDVNHKRLGRVAFLLVGGGMSRVGKSSSKQDGYWVPGQQLTEADLELLVPLIRRAEMLGYTPTKAEVRNVNKIKGRFRTWGNAVAAAGLQAVNTPEQHYLRAQAKQRRVREKEERCPESDRQASARAAPELDPPPDPPTQGRGG
jgi:hypothetical protein